MGSVRRTVDLGVDWHLSDGKGGYRRRRFATTTPATSLLIEVLAEHGATWAEVHDLIRYDDEAKAVCAEFIAAGHGETVARDLLAAYVNPGATVEGASWPR